jgi:molybdopterin converting factor small subunit
LTEEIERLKEAVTQLGEALCEVAEELIENLKRIIPDLTESLMNEIDEYFEKCNSKQAINAHNLRYAKGENYYRNQPKPITRKIHRIQKRG